MTGNIRLYVWPSRWNLHSFDPQCLAAVLYIQFALGSESFTIIETSNPDSSPSGQLPYLTNDTESFSPLSSIISYVTSLCDKAKETSASLSSDDFEHMSESISSRVEDALDPVVQAKAFAWWVFVEQQVGDLFAQSFFANWDNYVSTTHPALTDSLPYPQRLYSAKRVREMQRPRLEASLSWDQEPDEMRDELPAGASRTTSLLQSLRPREKFKSAYARERALERARSTFDALSALLVDDASYVYGLRATPLDCVLASYVLLFLHAPLSNPFIRTLLLDAYPKLVGHACFVHAQAFQRPDGSSLNGRNGPRVVTLREQGGANITDFVKAATSGTYESIRAVFAGNRPAFASQSEKDPAVLKQERSLRLGRYAFAALAVFGTVAYVASLGLRVRITFNEEEDKDDESDEDVNQAVLAAQREAQEFSEQVGGGSQFDVEPDDNGDEEVEDEEED